MTIDRRLAKRRTTSSYDLSDWHRGPDKGNSASRRVRSVKRNWRRAVRRHAAIQIAEARSES